MTTLATAVRVSQSLPQRLCVQGTGGRAPTHSFSHPPSAAKMAVVGSGRRGKEPPERSGYRAKRRDASTASFVNFRKHDRPTALLIAAGILVLVGSSASVSSLGAQLGHLQSLSDWVRQSANPVFSFAGQSPCRRHTGVLIPDKCRSEERLALAPMSRARQQGPGDRARWLMLINDAAGVLSIVGVTRRHIERAAEWARS